MAGQTCTAKDGTEIVNLFQGCASGFSPVMMVVKSLRIKDGAAVKHPAFRLFEKPRWRA